MKKLIIMSVLFLGLVGFAKAHGISIAQGQGTVYNHYDDIYSYPTWASSGEIESVDDVLIYGYLTNFGGGHAGVNVDVDTDQPAGYYWWAGDLPDFAGEFSIDLY